VVYSQFVQLHHSFPAILDSFSPTVPGIRPDVVRAGGQDSGLGRVYRVILGSVIWAVWYWVVIGMISEMRLWDVGCLPVHQLVGLVEVKRRLTFWVIKFGARPSAERAAM